MNSLFYACKLSFRNIFRFKFISFLRLLGIYICMFIVAVLFAVYFGSVHYINGSLLFSDIDTLNFYVAESPDKVPDFSNIQYNYEFHATQERVIYDASYLSGITFSVIDENFSDVYNELVIEGNNIVNPENECIIGENLLIKYDIKIGEILIIGNRDFTVVGITNIPRFSSQILLCNENVVKMQFPKFYFFRNNSDIIKLNKETLYQQEEIYIYFRKYLNSTSFISVCMSCIVIIIYSMLSVVNIHKFYNQKRCIANGVQFFTGASKRIVLFQNFFECAIISCLSSVFAYISVFYLLHMIIKFTFFYLYLPIQGLLIMLIFAIIISFFYMTNITSKQKYVED